MSAIFLFSILSAVLFFVFLRHSPIKVSKRLFTSLDDMKNGLVKTVIGGAKGLAASAVIGLAASGAGADLLPVQDFDFFAQISGKFTKTLYNNGDLTVNGSVPVDANYKVGLFMDGACVGYANNNDEREGTSSLSGYVCDMSGGQRSDSMIVIHDANGDGIGNYNTDTEMLEIGADDVVYTAGNMSPSNLIELDGIAGNVSALPKWGDGVSMLYLPSINLVDVPEPATLALLGTGAGALIYRERRKAKDIAKRLSSSRSFKN